MSAFQVNTRDKHPGEPNYVRDYGVFWIICVSFT